MKDHLYEFPTDSMIATDEWDHARYMIGEELKICDFKGTFLEGHLPFFSWFRGEIKDKLKKAGFKKSIIENKKRLETTMKNLNRQGKGNAYLSTNDGFPYGFPSEVVEFDNVNKGLYWIKSDIDAALRTLESLEILKELLVTDGVVNKEAVKVYLRSLELIINLSRAGNVPALAVSEADKRQKSLETRELKKLVMKCLIDNIFKKNPKRPKTLGEVWNKIDRGEEEITLRKSKKSYIAKTDKDAKGSDIVIITGDVEKPMEYAKRSLQVFIDEVKNTPLKVTQ
jgi:hypothetical protein